MRLALSNDAKMVLERIQTRCKVLNPDIEKGASLFLYRALLNLERNLSKDQWEQLAAQTTSERMKNKRKFERLKELATKIEDSDIDKFEAKIERKNVASNSDFSKNNAEIS